MTTPQDKIKGIRVLLKVNNEWVEVELDEHIALLLFKVLDKNGRIKVKPIKS